MKIRGRKRHQGEHVDQVKEKLDVVSYQVATRQRLDIHENRCTDKSLTLKYMMMMILVISMDSNLRSP